MGMVKTYEPGKAFLVFLGEVEGGQVEEVGRRKVGLSGMVVWICFAFLKVVDFFF